MNWIQYISIYFIVGLVIMTILDSLQNYIEKKDPGLLLHDGYTNRDRFFIISLWPAFIFSLIFSFLANKNK